MTRIVLAATFAALAFVSGAEAKGKHHFRFHRPHQHHQFVYRHRHGVRFTHHFGDGRPRAWCGWQMRQWLGDGPSNSNLARNWAHWGHAVGAAIGAVVVYPHHVAQIVGSCYAGGCVMRSGNDGHAIRTRWRRLAGNIGIREK